MLNSVSAQTIKSHADLMQVSVKFLQSDGRAHDDSGGGDGGGDGIWRRRWQSHPMIGGGGVGGAEGPDSFCANDVNAGGSSCQKNGSDKLRKPSRAKAELEQNKNCSVHPRLRQHHLTVCQDLHSKM